MNINTPATRSLRCRTLEPHDSRADGVCVSALVVLLMVIMLLGAGS